MIEFYVDEAFISFDGRVVEVWGRTKNLNGRLHVGVINTVEVKRTDKKNYLSIQTLDWSGNIQIPFSEAQRPWVEQLQTELEQAVASWKANLG